jgi:hypothetical protein
MATLTPIGADLKNTSAFGNGLWVYDSYAVVGAPGGL